MNDKERIKNLENDVNDIKLTLLIGRFVITVVIAAMLAIQWGYL